jgi:uncharacterized damage-inducible protein DinB
MNYAKTILPEFDREMANTRKVLERIPDGKLDWQAHPKSHTIGWNANHLAEILGWVAGMLTMPVWDFAPIGGEPYHAPKLTSLQQILDLFDRNVAAARKAIAVVKDDQLKQPWSLVCAGTPIFTMPRRMAVRRFVLNHLIHHRAILSVYLHLNDIPVPRMYDPSGAQ